ncbi:MAG: helix-hairpin-helix domain-containing protein, partial [Arenicellales bacterium]
AAADQPPAKGGGEADLTQLTGVGPVLAEKLHTAGVTSLSQIAQWTEDDIARIDEALGVKARIERDDWVGQAKKLTEKSG